MCSRKGNLWRGDIDTGTSPETIGAILCPGFTDGTSPPAGYDADGLARSVVCASAWQLWLMHREDI
jgi:hypothetical protein